MDSGFPQPDIDPTPDLVVGAALLAPGYCDHLSTWRMTIDSEGTVLQELHPTFANVLYETACIRLRSWIGPHRIDSIRATADEIAFASLKDNYPAACDDMETTSITYKRGGEFERVVVYGPHFLATDGDEEMVRYVRFWERENMVRHEPADAREAGLACGFKWTQDEYRNN